MKRFVEGEDRRQATLLPECLDDYVTPDNPVRVIEVFIDELDLGAVGFAGVVPAACLSSRDAAEDLSLRLSQPHPVEPAA
jgi:Transposase and inactivated derivatives